jgi:hypothetical protein
VQSQSAFSISIESGEFGENANEVGKGWARIRGSTNLPDRTPLLVEVNRKGVFTDLDPHLDNAAARTWTGVRTMMPSIEGEQALVRDGHFDTGVFPITEPKPPPPDTVRSEFLPTVWVLVGERIGYGPGGASKYLTASREFPFPVQPAQTSPAEVNKSGQDAYYMSREFVERRLKAPATARFPDYTPKFSNLVGHNHFIVTAYVDSQNSFGALIRTPYIVRLEYLESDDLWHLRGIAFIDDQGHFYGLEGKP